MTKQEIGTVLMRLREKSGKTRDEVAELLNKSVKTIGHWETGYAQPDANTLFLLCTIYDADLNESFGFPPSPEYKENLSSAEREHIKKYRTLDPYGQEAVDGVLDTEYRRCLDDAKGGAVALDEQLTPPPVEVAGPELGPDYSHIQFAAYGGADKETFDQSEQEDVELFGRMISRIVASRY